MNIDKIIRESINRVITEGYAGKDYEYLVNSYEPNIAKWLDYAKRTYIVEPFRFILNVNVERYNLIADDGTKLAGSMPVSVRICYRPDYVLGKHGVGGKTSLSMQGISIEVIATKPATIEQVKSVLLHEITHVVDELICMFKGYKQYRHQPDDYLSIFPPAVGEVIYRLWDTTEFNAWQTNLDLNEFVEDIMEDLQKANEINEPFFWLILGGYLESAAGMRSTQSPQRIKKYFLSTSFKLLKKYIKKYKIKG